MRFCGGEREGREEGGGGRRGERERREGREKRREKGEGKERWGKDNIAYGERSRYVIDKIQQMDSHALYSVIDSVEEKEPSIHRSMVIISCTATHYILYKPENWHVYTCIYSHAYNLC